MVADLLHVAVGASFMFGVGGFAYSRARAEAARASELTGPTRVLMLVTFGGLGATVASAASRSWALRAPPDDWSNVGLSAVGLVFLFVGGFIVLAVFAGNRKRTWAVDTADLATTGIYGRTRNPRALGWVLIYIGLALTTHSAAVLALVPVFLLGYLPWIFLEEAALERRFGSDYREYRRRTPRFI